MAFFLFAFVEMGADDSGIASRLSMVREGREKT